MVGNFRIYLLYDIQSKITKKIFGFKIMMKPCPQNIASLTDIQTIGVRLFFDSIHFLYHIPILNLLIWIYINFMYFFIVVEIFIFCGTSQSCISQFYQHYVHCILNVCIN